MSASEPPAGASAGSTSPSVDSFLEARLHPPPPRQLDRARPAARRPGPGAPRSPSSPHPPATARRPLAQWLRAAALLPPPGWRSTPADDDPRRLWTHVALALEQAGCRRRSDLERLPRRQRGRHRRVLARIVNALAAVPDDVVILLDDFHCLQDPACHDQVALLVDEPARAGPPGHRHPRRPRPPARTAASLRRLAEIRADRARLPRGRGGGAAGAARCAPVRATGSACSWSARRAGRPGSTSPPCRWPAGTTRTRWSTSSRAATASSATTSPRRCSAGTRTTPASSSRACRSSTASPPRCATPCGAGRGRPRSSTTWSARTCSCPARRGATVVPLPPPLRRRGAGRARGRAPATRARAACPGRRVVPAARLRRRGRRARPGRRECRRRGGPGPGATGSTTSTSAGRTPCSRGSSPW